jgi:hypothetical protein
MGNVAFQAFTGCSVDDVLTAAKEFTIGECRKSGGLE